jgi:haloalkane dehalogenase
LPDFPFHPRYVTVGDRRIHYVDEGQGETVLCLHGEPTWSFLYRKMIPPLSQTLRVVAFDFLGFGRSDKLTDVADYTFALHCQTMVGVIEALGLERITLVVQDWGGSIGLWVATHMPERFARLVILNTALVLGEAPSPALAAFQATVRSMAPEFPIVEVIKSALPGASEDVLAAYAAPFPDATYKAGAIAWPLMATPKEADPLVVEMRGVRDALSQWDKPTLVMFSDNDPFLGGDRFFRDLIPAAREQPEIVIRGAGHFLQEERGAEVAGHVLELINRTPL